MEKSLKRQFVLALCIVFPLTSFATAKPDASNWVSASNALAFELMRALDAADVGRENVVLSSPGITVVLDMLHGGARGDTRQELEGLLPGAMAPLSSRVLRPTFQTENMELTLATHAWIQHGQSVLPAWRESITTRFNAEVFDADFAAAPEKARRQINETIARQTAQRLKELMPSGSINHDTRLVLTTASYFLAPWKRPFSPSLTRKSAFTTLSGKQTMVDMMQIDASFGYFHNEHMSAVTLPYRDERMALLAVLPAEGQFAKTHAAVGPALVQDILRETSPTRMRLQFPKLLLGQQRSLQPPLMSLGIKTLFDPGKANLSGINGERNLFVQAIMHGTYLRIDESGTEAAAATGAGVGITSLPDLFVSVNRPFFLMIIDRETGLLWFLGKIVEPE